MKETGRKIGMNSPIIINTKTNDQLLDFLHMDDVLH